jgi:hypothetical protein
VKVLALALASALAATCTHQTPTPPAKFDAGQASCSSACATLATLSCPEGLDPSCVASCEHAPVLHVDMHVACLAGATTKDAARACRSVSCP